jgi:hypothetical protein
MLPRFWRYCFVADPRDLNRRGLFLILIVAAMPGVLAKKRHSPWAEAINVAGWIGVLCRQYVEHELIANRINLYLALGGAFGTKDTSALLARRYRSVLNGPVNWVVTKCGSKIHRRVSVPAENDLTCVAW